MKKVLIVFFIFINGFLSAQYSIKFHIKNYEDSTLVISYPNGERSFIGDTLVKNSEDVFLFEGEYDLEPGVYFAGKYRNKSKFRFILKPDDDNFDAYFDFSRDIALDFKGSKENNIYKDFLLKSKDISSQLNLYRRGREILDSDVLYNQLNDIRRQTIEKYPNTIVAELLKSEMDWVDPKFENIDKKDIEAVKLDYQIKHFLDGLDLKNPISFRLPATHKRIIHYFDGYVHKKPEVVNKTIDSLFNVMGPNSAMFKYYLPFFLKRYNKSYINWFDSTYIHIAEKYYDKTKTPWISKETIELVHYYADKKKRTLIGKVAPELTLDTEKKDSINLFDIKADYSVLVFWKPGCSHCRHAMPFLREIKEKYKDEKLKIITICAYKGKLVNKCYESIKKEEMEGFDFNLVDKSGRSDFIRDFNVTSVPSIFILDKNKTIIDKSIKAKNLVNKLSKIVK